MGEWKVRYLVGNARSGDGDPLGDAEEVVVGVDADSEAGARDAGRIAIMALRPDGIKWEREAWDAAEGPGVS